MVPDLPLIVQILVVRYLPQVLAWLSSLVYDLWLAREADHPLVRLHGQLDMRPIEVACAGYYRDSGRGAPPRHSVRQLCRVLLLQAWYRDSYRECAARLRYAWVARWFAGYRLDEATPEASTLYRFARWVRVNQPRFYFDEVLRQLDAADPAQRRLPQVGDSFALHALAPPESLIERLRHAHRKLLAALEQLGAALGERVRAACDLSALLGATGEVPSMRLDRRDWLARLRQTVQASLACQQLTRALLPSAPDPAQVAAVERWLDLLAKLLADELALGSDPASGELTVRLLDAAERGSYRWLSATDPEATFRVHGTSPDVLGYNISLAASTRYIREIRADTGALPDPLALPFLLLAQQQNHDLRPPKLVYDSAAGTGKSLALVTALSDGQTRLVTPLIAYEARSERFGPSAFALSEDGSTLTCPNGQTSTRRYRAGSAEGVQFRFTAPQCRACPLWDKCRAPASSPKAPRQVFISDYRGSVEEARTYNQRAEYRTDMRLRPMIEQTIAILVRYHGARYARAAGLAAADFQVKMAATCFNLKRWLAAPDPPRAPPPADAPAA